MVLVGVEFRSTAPITLTDKTSGFNGMAGYDLKY